MGVFEVLYSAFMILLFIVIATSLVYEKRSHISPTPVLPQVRRKAISMIPETFLASGSYDIADLGCGWGGLLMALSRKFPSARMTGYEISPFPFWMAKFKSRLFASNVSVLDTDFFGEDLSKFDLVFCYLSPWHMEKLKPQLSGLKRGSVIISCSFPIEGWKPLRIEKVRGIFVSIPLFLYVVK